jgi:hypothetical protein
VRGNSKAAKLVHNKVFKLTTQKLKSTGSNMMDSSKIKSLLARVAALKAQLVKKSKSKEIAQKKVKVLKSIVKRVNAVAIKVAKKVDADAG